MTTTLPAVCSFAEFAGIARVRKSYVTDLRKAGRLVLTDDGKAVRVAESLARIEATRSPAHEGVAARHASERGAQAMPAALPPPTSADAPEEAPEAPANNPHSLRRAQALADREEALARKALRDEQLELGQLLSLEETERALADAMTRFRAALEAQAYDLAPELAAIADEARVHARLTEFNEGLLAELARSFAVLTKGDTHA